MEQKKCLFFHRLFNSNLLCWFFCFVIVLFLHSGNTSGLLGFWNEEQENEFLLPNGTFLDTNSSQTTIHYKFGQLCKSYIRFQVITDTDTIVLLISWWVLQNLGTISISAKYFFSCIKSHNIVSSHHLNDVSSQRDWILVMLDVQVGIYGKIHSGKEMLVFFLQSQQKQGSTKTIHDLQNL